jgi:hypothetical protein
MFKMFTLTSRFVFSQNMYFFLDIILMSQEETVEIDEFLLQWLFVAERETTHLLECNA